jgi:hypothetical protein
MDALPFSDAEWDAVVAMSRAVVNATLAEDRVLAASALVELQGVLADLRARYGDHPILAETEADFVRAVGAMGEP